MVGSECQKSVATKMNADIVKTCPEVRLKVVLVVLVDFSCVHILSVILRVSVLKIGTSNVWNILRNLWIGKI